MSPRGRTLAILAVIAGLGVGTVAIFFARRAEQRKAIQYSYDRFSQCVIGAPLEKDEKVRPRLRDVERALLADAKEPSLLDPVRWPRTCRAEASAFHSALSRLSGGRTSADERLQQSLYPLVVALDDRADFDGLVRVFVAARESGLVAKQVAGAPTAPQPIRPILTRVEPLPLRFVSVGPAPVESQPFGLLHGKETRLCTDPFDVAPVTCPKITARPESLRVVPSAIRGETWYYDPLADDREAWLVFHSLGKQTRRHTIPKGFRFHAARVEKDALLTLEVNEKSDELLLSLERDGEVRPKSVRARSRPLPGGPLHIDSSPYLVGDFVIETSEGERGPVVLARHIEREPLALSNPEPVLEAFGVLPCAGRDGIALVGLAPNGKSVDGIALHDGTEWHAHRVAGSGFASALYCGSGVVVVHSIAGTSSIQKLRCNSQRCTKESENLTLGRPSGSVAAAALAEKTLVMWRTELGDVRMRIGAMGELEQVMERVVFVDGNGDEPERVAWPTLIPHGDRTLALVGSGDGMVPLMIDANGSVTALPLARPN